MTEAMLLECLWVALVGRVGLMAEVRRCASPHRARCRARERRRRARLTALEHRFRPAARTRGHFGLVILTSARPDAPLTARLPHAEDHYATSRRRQTARRFPVQGHGEGQFQLGPLDESARSRRCRSSSSWRPEEFRARRSTLAGPPGRIGTLPKEEETGSSGSRSCSA